MCLSESGERNIVMKERESESDEGEGKRVGYVAW